MIRSPDLVELQNAPLTYSLCQQDHKNSKISFEKNIYLYLSSPNEAISSEDENADKSKWAPVCVKAPPVSFGQPWNSPELNFGSNSVLTSSNSVLISKSGWTRFVKSYK